MLKHTGILLTFIVIVMVGVSGCGAPVSSPTPTTVNNNSTGDVPASVPPAVSLPGGLSGISLPGMSSQNTAAFNPDKVKWYEYKITEVTADGDTAVVTEKYEFSKEAYGGASNARHKKVTMSIQGQDGSFLWEEYADPSNGNLIGGHYKVVESGGAAHEGSLEPGAGSSSMAAFELIPISTYLGAETNNLKALGSETLNVDAGTFKCDIYALPNVNIWVDPNVPVPIKMRSDKDTGETWEADLTGWAPA